MINIFFKKIINSFLLILFLFPFHVLHAVDIVDSDDVIVSARVIDPNVVVTPIPVESPAGAVNLFLPKIGVTFKGEAYPNATIFLLKNAQQILSVVAGTDGFFNMSLEEKYEDTVLYTIYAQDVLGNRSLLVNYPVAVYSGYITELSNIRFAPTIVTDKSEVAYGDYLTISGYAMPNRALSLSIAGGTVYNYSLTSALDGSYKLTIPLVGYAKGEYVVSVKYLNDTRLSKFLKFLVGDSNKKNDLDSLSIPGDCNKDNIINLIDFSILAFWYKKTNPPLCVDTNNDKIVDLIDFSILAYYWTD